MSGILIFLPTARENGARRRGWLEAQPKSWNFGNFTKETPLKSGAGHFLFYTTFWSDALQGPQGYLSQVLCCVCDVVWCCVVGWGLVKVCIFHTRKMHVYLIVLMYYCWHVFSETCSKSYFLVCYFFIVCVPFFCLNYYFCVRIGTKILRKKINPAKFSSSYKKYVLPKNEE